MTLSRREFVLAATATAAAPFIRLRADADIVIRDGMVFDGSGAPPREGDVVIVGGKVVAIERRSSQKGTLEIDARGQAVAPGFIDIHSHGDGSLVADPRAESLIRQGITTIVAGQDGSSAGAQGGLAAAMQRIADAKPAVNVASMIGLGSIRGAIVGNADRPATADELQRMRALVESALADGACGASSGLEYTPGGFASTAELIALCEPLASRGLPYATHMRNEDDRLLESIDESIAVARGAKCPLQISHLKTQGERNWPKLDAVFARVAAARAAGIDTAFDRYPYVAYQTGLSNLFPIWSRDGGNAAFVARFDSASVASRIRTETLAKVDLIGGWKNVMITSAPAEHAAAVGARVDAYAARTNADPYETAVALIKSSRGGAGMVGFAMSETNLDRILAHPQGMVCSDGGSFAIDNPRGSPHPRGLGTFPRVLGRYVRERKALSLPSAINKMTALPASRIKLRDRGRLAVGAAADVVVFDPATVADTATYEKPFQYPVGIKAVIVNGATAFLEGQRTGSGTGMILRPSS